MQIQMQAFSKRKLSLRRRITVDLGKHSHPVLFVEEFKAADRPQGWAKIKGEGMPGVLNLEWDPDQRMLTARAIAKKGNLPHALLGVFVAYLLEKHGRRLSAINIQLS